MHSLFSHAGGSEGAPLKGERLPDFGTNGWRRHKPQVIEKMICRDPDGLQQAIVRFVLGKFMRMLNSRLLRTLIDGRSVFFREFLKHPLEIGSVIPSSRFLERRVVEAAGVRSAGTIIELGPGTGGTTRAILRAMRPHAKLLAIEINPNFHAFVSSMEDDRLIAHLGNAQELKEIIEMYSLNSPEAVISGIPFSNMSDGSGAQILNAIVSVLAPGGCFVAYQVRKQVACISQPFLGSGRMAVELLNIPPLRVYRWQKKGA